MATEPRHPVVVVGWQLWCIATVAAVLLAGCGKDEGERAVARGDAAVHDESLPAPEAGRGGVTGMPALPGPGAIGPPDPFSPDPAYPAYPADATDATDATDNPAVMPATQDPYADADLAFDPPPLPDRHADGPGAGEAVALVRQYYAALDNGDFAQAYRLWSDDGAASERSPQQFADSFAGTASRRVEILEPGRIEAAAGSRRIEVPVAIEEIRRDGSVLRQVGTYTLRRSVADGTNAKQSAWRISAADLRQVRP